MRNSTALIALLLVLPAAPSAGETKYAGFCDVSAAIALGPDHFVAGEDETDVLAIYRRGTPTPVARVDLVDFLGNRNKKGNAKEADFEGAARVGDVIYWIASHARDSKGNVEETRRRFFATSVTGTGASPTVSASGQPYKLMLNDLLGDPALASLNLAKAAELAPELPNALNIEGLAATPEGQLLIGFRNPLPKDLAIVLPLTNPQQVVAGVESAKFGAPILLDLEGRGIRSMERVGNRYLIVAGPFNSGTGGGRGSDFALFSWNGKPDAKAERVKADFGKLRPEGMFAIPGSTDLEILSDDGDEPFGANTKCKDPNVPPPNKTFRTIRIPIPAE